MTPAILRLADAERVRDITGFSPDQLRRLAREQGAPVRVRGTGKGRREFVVVDELVDWVKNNSARMA